MNSAILLSIQAIGEASLVGAILALSGAVAGITLRIPGIQYLINVAQSAAGSGNELLLVPIFLAIYLLYQLSRDSIAEFRRASKKPPKRIRTSRSHKRKETLGSGFVPTTG